MTLMVISPAHEPLKPVVLQQWGSGVGRHPLWRGYQLWLSVLSSLFFSSPPGFRPLPRPPAELGRLGSWSDRVGPELHAPRPGQLCGRTSISSLHRCGAAGAAWEVGCGSPRGGPREEGTPHRGYSFPAGPGLPQWPPCQAGQGPSPAVRAPWFPRGDHGYGVLWWSRTPRGVREARRPRPASSMAQPDLPACGAGSTPARPALPVGRFGRSEPRGPGGGGPCAPSAARP